MRKSDVQFLKVGGKIEFKDGALRGRIAEVTKIEPPQADGHCRIEYQLKNGRNGGTITTHVLLAS